MNDIKFSIIIPVYNNTDSIYQCLDSIYNQTYKNFEVILVDDCSTNTEYSHLSTKYEKINVIRLPENRGPGVARQTGLDHANGDWVFFVDSDDTLISQNVMNYIYDMCKKIFNAYIIRCNFFQVSCVDGKRYRTTPILSELLPMHGMIFNLKFIKDNNIRFHDNLRVHEDAYFYLLCKYTMNNSSIDKYGHFIQLPEFVYNYNNIQNTITSRIYGLYSYIEYTTNDQDEMFLSLYKRLYDILNEDDKQDILFTCLMCHIFFYNTIEQMSDLSCIDTRKMRLLLLSLRVFKLIVTEFNISSRDELQKIFTDVYNRDAMKVFTMHEYYLGPIYDAICHTLDKFYSFYLEVRNM